MDPTDGRDWFLRKHEDGNVFGPLPFETIARWASVAQIAPHDALSTDQETWLKAPMLPELGMDWLVEVTSERYYGPTTLGAIQEFIRAGEINHDTFVINSCDGSRMPIHQVPELVQPPEITVEAETDVAIDPTTSSEPAAIRMSIDLPDRIRELEQSLREERRALQEAEERYRELEAQYQKLVEDGSTNSAAS